MSLEGSPLDLNNFPGDYNSSDRDKQIVEDNSSSSTGHRLKRNGVKEVIDENGKVYKCRFCSLKFYKSQALGGHMNRHRQERETETLNRARQLVFNTDNLAVHHHLGGQPAPHGALYNQTSTVGDHNLYRPIYPPPRLFPNSPSSHIPLTQPLPPQPHLLYPPPPPRFIPYTSPYPPPHDTIHYTCIGEPIRRDFPAYSGGSHSDAAASNGERGKTYF